MYELYTPTTFLAIHFQKKKKYEKLKYEQIIIIVL